jgi:hypothetical protein
MFNLLDKIFRQLFSSVRLICHRNNVWLDQLKQQIHKMCFILIFSLKVVLCLVLLFSTDKHLSLWLSFPLPFVDSHLQDKLDQNDQMFKPGWKDIFRMNQSELEAEVRKVSRDPTLDPRRKAYLIQNLMTRFDIWMFLWVACYKYEYS